MTSSPPFTSDEARKTFTEACRIAGLPSEDAELLRLGENAIFRTGPVVVRIARGLDVLEDARKEVAVATWLREAGLLAAEPTQQDQPLIVRDKPVTFWRLIDDSGIKPGLEDLGRVLRDLHQLPVPKDLLLPEFNIFGRVSERIVKTRCLSDADQEFLINRLTDLQEQYTSLNYSLPRSAVHGDAHQGNLMTTRGGAIILIDFERFAFGPPESDLTVTATEHLIGWHTNEEYAKFVKSYGFDVMDWEGFSVLRSINELKMTTWLMQNVGEGDHVEREFRARLASLRDDDGSRPWQPF